MSHKVRIRIFALALFATIVSGGLVACSGDSPERLVASARTYLANNQQAAAIIQLNNALQKRPDFGEARYLLGKAMFEQEHTGASGTTSSGE